MNNPTFLAQIQKLESDEIEWLESSDFKNSNEYAKDLDQKGYIVLSVVPQDSYKMW